MSVTLHTVLHLYTKVWHTDMKSSRGVCKQTLDDSLNKATWLSVRESGRGAVGGGGGGGEVHLRFHVAMYEGHQTLAEGSRISHRKVGLLIVHTHKHASDHQLLPQGSKFESCSGGRGAGSDGPCAGLCC